MKTLFTFLLPFLLLVAFAGQARAEIFEVSGDLIIGADSKVEVRGLGQAYTIEEAHTAPKNCINGYFLLQKNPDGHSYSLLEVIDCQWELELNHFLDDEQAQELVCPEIYAPVCALDWNHKQVDIGNLCQVNQLQYQFLSYGTCKFD